MSPAQPTDDGAARHDLSPARTLMFAVAAAFTVATLYWSQPLIEVIAEELGVSPASAAALVTVSQVGYAVGVALLLPLGDVVDRRRLIPLMLTLTAAALVGAALAPSFSALLVALAAVGVTTVSAQLLIPLASELASPERRGRAVGAIAAGAILGILLSRTVSGAIADLLGWRAVYAFAAVGTLTLAVVLRRAIPRLAPRPHLPYGRLLASVPATVGAHRAALPTLAVAGSAFAVFSLFWTALTYLLTADPYGFSLAQIGLTGLLGAAGALAARRAGGLHDRGWSVPATGVALAVLAVSLAATGAVPSSLPVLLVVIVVFDVALHGTMVLSQTRLLSLPGNNRSRLNTAFVVTNFVGASLGSAAAGVLWAAGGWPAVTAAGVAMTLLALSVWALTRKRLADPT